MVGSPPPHPHPPDIALALTLNNMVGDVAGENIPERGRGVHLPEPPLLVSVDPPCPCMVY